MQAHVSATVKPETEPEINHGYLIIQRIYVGDKVFKLSVNKDAVQKYVTWQSFQENPDSYDWGHYWSEKSTAKTDLFYRADAERRGVSYDHTTLYKQSKNRYDAR